jgi:hypothetical protein
MIKSVGVVSTYINNNGKKNGENLFWDYDGNKINLDILTNKNGKNDEKYFELTNKDIVDILNVPGHQQSLDKRLMNDFLPNTNIIRKNISKKNIYKTPINKKQKTRNKKQKTKTRNKNKKQKTKTRNKNKKQKQETINKK